MGYYTELVFWSPIRSTAPPEVHAALAYLCDAAAAQPEKLPGHPFFGLPRWRMIGRGSSASNFSERPSAYADGHLHINCSLKNYDDEINAFLNWIAPYVAVYDGWLGYSTHDEGHRPTLYFYDYESRRITELYPDGDPTPIRYRKGESHGQQETLETAQPENADEAQKGVHVDGDPRF